MTDKQYPLLPLPAGYYGDDRSLIGVSPLDPIFTEQQMRAYVDADRAQRSALTDAECEAISNAEADFWGSMREGDLWSKYGNSQHARAEWARLLKARNERMRAAIANIHHPKLNIEEEE